MNITDPRLATRLEWIEKVLGTLTDSKYSIPVLQSRIPSVKEGLKTLTDQLLQAKIESKDPLFISQIDDIVSYANESYRELASKLMEYNPNKMIDKGISEAGKFMAEYNTPETKEETTMSNPLEDVFNAPLEVTNRKIVPVSNVVVGEVPTAGSNTFMLFANNSISFFDDKNTLSQHIVDNKLAETDPNMFVMTGTIGRPKVEVKLEGF